MPPEFRALLERYNQLGWLLPPKESTRCLPIRTGAGGSRGDPARNGSGQGWHWRLLGPPARLIQRITDERGTGRGSPASAPEAIQARASCSLGKLWAVEPIPGSAGLAVGLGMVLAPISLPPASSELLEQFDCAGIMSGSERGYPAGDIERDRA
jgi:hypothetical protein